MRLESDEEIITKMRLHNSEEVEDIDSLAREASRENRGSAPPHTGLRKICTFACRAPTSRVMVILQYLTR